jgi:hypothetical protein
VVDDEGAPPAPAPAPEESGRPPLNPRQLRARRRRRRRQLGTLIFLLVAGAILAAAYFAVAGGNDTSSNDQASGTSTTLATTTTAAFSGTYKTSTGVNVRQAPATTAPVVGTVEQGKDVTVSCVANGEMVSAGSASSSQWLKISAPAGYVSAAYVSAGDDLRANKIPACPAA